MGEVAELPTLKVWGKFGRKVEGTNKGREREKEEEREKRGKKKREIVKGEENLKWKMEGGGKV